MANHLERVCFLDLDGVLVDFVGGALRQYQRELPYADIRWDFYDRQLGIPENEFWEPLGFDFWANLEWTPDGREILRLVEDIFGPERIGILSNPCETRGCDDGKRAWVRQHIPRYSRKLLLGSAKHLIAGHGKYLIDDYDANVTAFRGGRGHALLVPRPWNSRRDEVEGETFDIEAMAEELIKLARNE